MRKKIQIAWTFTMFISRLLKMFVVTGIFMVAGCSKDNQEESAGPVMSSNLKAGVTNRTAAEAIAEMGTGFNLGNTFDLAQHSTDPSSIKPLIDLYYNNGMRHIRIPVTWMDGFNGNHLADGNGILNYRHARFLQLVQVIDYAILKGMYVVLNTHHEHWLKNNYDGSATYNNKFTNLWIGIANFFRNYSNRLIFEVLNEPEGKFGSWSGTVNPQDPVAIALTRQIMKVGYDAIRSTGGGNATRIVLISPNAQANSYQIDDVYPTKSTLPKGGADAYIAIQVHSYDPWNFCGEDGRNFDYPGRRSVIEGVNITANHAAILGIAVHYGEFGVGRKETFAFERNSWQVREYYRTMKLTIISKKMAATVWDDRGWFGLVTANVPYNFLNNIVPTMMAQTIVGKTITLKGNNNMYVSGQNGTMPMWCNRSTASDWEKFYIVDIGPGSGKIALRSMLKYVSSENGSPSGITCNRTSIDEWESFWFEFTADGKVAFIGSNGMYLCSENGTSVMTCNRAVLSDWEKFSY